MNPSLSAFELTKSLPRSVLKLPVSVQRPQPKLAGQHVATRNAFAHPSHVCCTSCGMQYKPAMAFISNLPLPPWLATYLATTYDTLFGDIATDVFLKEYLPLLYVSIVPLINVLLKLFCVCDPSVMTAAQWPPRLSEPDARTRGQRVVRRVINASAGISRMATAAALTAARSNKSSRNKCRTQAALTAQMNRQYDATPQPSMRSSV